MTARTRRLGPREHETVQLLARGLTTADIARRLGVNPNTVRYYVRCIGQKWGTANRDEIIVLACQLGIVPTEPAEPDGDSCHLVQTPAGPVRVRAHHTPSPSAAAAIGEIVAAARRRYAAEHPEEQ